MHRFRLGRALLIGAALALPTSLFAEPSASEPAATEPAVAEPAPRAQRSGPTERSQEQELILQRQLPASEQRQLQAGDERFLALWLPALTERAEGTVILIPGYGQHANHPDIIGPLRNRLPEVGWNTLSISLPDALNATARSPTPAPDTEAPENDAQTGEQSAPVKPSTPAERLPVEQSQMSHTASAEALPEAEPSAPAEDREQDHAERIFARIDAAIAEASKEQPAQIVLAGSGTGAYWAARHSTERPAGAVQRLVLISLSSPTARVLAQSSAALPEIPTADIFYRNRRDEQSAARQRQLASQRQKHQHYRAIGLQALPADREAEREQLYRRLRGWLSPSRY